MSTAISSAARRWRQRLIPVAGVTAAVVTLSLAAPASGGTAQAHTRAVQAQSASAAKHQPPPPARLVDYVCLRTRPNVCIGSEAGSPRRGFEVTTRLRSGRNLWYYGVWHFNKVGTINRSNITKRINQQWMNKYTGSPEYLVETGRDPGLCLGTASPTSARIVFTYCDHYVWVVGKDGTMWMFIRGIRPPNNPKIFMPVALTVPTANRQPVTFQSGFPRPKNTQKLEQILAYVLPAAGAMPRVAISQGAQRSQQVLWPAA